ncbi:UDP-glucose 4-epimerase [Salinivirga cyanobacteriivorans]|uniref:UDP-glucose 4-epimerase n=1 Tax=Salinivirga cyanobacteriivorans TaxID=1307839 RepID=A0A0S2HW66_9BACT|nr:NAD-dependent epimerase/dehydratase family protein [Salinivirga cyanobacteriivorans]ALO14280.1 UDP-glucose 4-epimerase [Salinivirga cyanobacteriivorans]
MSRVLITGAAGFIGFHLTKKLMNKGFEITGIDEINDYYEPKLKRDRLQQLGIQNAKPGTWVSNPDGNLNFIQASTYDKDIVEDIFDKYDFDYVIHLAAQAGVRNSIDNPYKYTQSNIEGFLPILEACRHKTPKHLIFASSSSIYGNNTKIPFEESDAVDHPISLYAATKKANELMAHTYSHLYNIPVTGLRFFTVYGPWGRPDMAYFKFAKAIFEGNEIEIFNNGDLKRDFTYIDDITEGIEKLLDKPSEDSPTYDIFNIGNSHPVKLMDFISTLEQELGKEAKKVYKPMQPGDVYKTYASTEKLNKKTGYQPATNLKEGLSVFAEWFLNYYHYK